MGASPLQRLTSYPQLGRWLAQRYQDDDAHDPDHRRAGEDGLRLLKETVAHAALLRSPEDVTTFHLPPVPTGSSGWDATLAAAASILARRCGLPAPAWTSEPWRTVQGLWSPVPPLPRWRGRAFVDTPIEFRTRGVLLRRQDLVSV